MMPWRASRGIADLPTVLDMVPWKQQPVLLPQPSVQEGKTAVVHF